MWVLLDYDNLPNLLRQRGPKHVADRIVDTLRPALATSTQRLDLKLYGGWYRHSTLTTLAQSLNAALASDFPFVSFIQDTGAARRRVTVAANLAHALEVNPRTDIHNTFRLRDTSEHLACKHPHDSGCIDTECELISTFRFFESEICPKVGCSITPSALLKRRGEQKLVDTMMVADLIHLAQVGETHVAIVTSDDDVWPGIISAMIRGTHVIHVETKWFGRAVPYRSGVSGKYTRLQVA